MVDIGVAVSVEEVSDNENLVDVTWVDVDGWPRTDVLDGYFAGKAWAETGSNVESVYSKSQQIKLNARNGTPTVMLN